MKNSDCDIDHRTKIISPCIGNCCLDEKDFCLGCYRHIDEITGWHSADRPRKLEILNNCDRRKETKSKI